MGVGTEEGSDYLFTLALMAVFFPFSMTTVKAKAVRSGAAGAGAEEPFPEVEAGSCSGNPAPAPNGPMTSSVGKKGRLKTTRVGQRTEKRRTICNPPLSRGRSDGSSYPGGTGARKWLVKN